MDDLYRDPPDAASHLDPYEEVQLLRTQQRLPAEAGAARPSTRCRLQPVRSHGRLRQVGIQAVGRPADCDPPSVPGICGTNAPRPVRDGRTAVDPDRDPHAGDGRRAAGSRKRPLRHIGHRSGLDRNPRAVRGPLRGSRHAGVEVRIRSMDEPGRPIGGGNPRATDELAKEFLGGEAIPSDEEGWFATGDLGRHEDGSCT